jgi:pyruvate-formate lyase-activating enzyme
MIQTLNKEIFTIKNPNFTIVTPGGCNAKCEFCFWHQEKTTKNYLNKLKETMDLLPSQFYMISISGGEPTISPYFTKILDLIDTDQFTHRILTTNGTHLMKHMDKISEKIQHINISRHHWNDEINNKIFISKTVPSSKHITECVDALNQNGIDVTFSCVLTDEYILTKEDIIKYVEYAKNCGASHIYFRKKHENLLPHELEKEFGVSKIINSHDCPVCRTRIQLIKGIDVHWKTSVLEPSETLTDILFETIFNSNGTLTSDWVAEKVINPALIHDPLEKYLPKNFCIDCGAKYIDGEPSCNC